MRKQFHWAKIALCATLVMVACILLISPTYYVFARKDDTLCANYFPPSSIVTQLDDAPARFHGYSLYPPAVTCAWERSAAGMEPYIDTHLLPGTWEIPVAALLIAAGIYATRNRSRFIPR